MNQEELTNHEREQLLKTIKENYERIKTLKEALEKEKLVAMGKAYKELDDKISKTNTAINNYKEYNKALFRENVILLRWILKFCSNVFVKLLFPKLTKEILTFTKNSTSQEFTKASIKNFYTGEVEPLITPCDFDVNSTYKNDNFN
jgi:hypothetical protein